MKVTAIKESIECDSDAGFSYITVSKIYRNGKSISGEITPTTLEEDTYLLKAVAINGVVIELKIYGLESSGNTISYNYNIHSKGISDDILNAIEDIHSVCDYYYKHNDIAIT
jgi:hypothetical protein